MLRFATLASGSRGNASLVESGDTLLMLDCGLPCREIEQRLAALGRSGEDVAALLVTHEHTDHLRGVGAFARRYGTRIFATHGTARALVALPGNEGLDVEPVSTHRGFSIGAIDVEPFPVPHDAHEPCQFVFAAGRRRLGVLTDAGHATAHIRERLAGCDALAVECNHDVESLVRGSYPPSVKARVGSAYGHMSNAQAAELVASLADGRLQWVVAMHVSERNNSHALVVEALEPVLDRHATPLAIAKQDAPGAWIEVV